MPWTWGRLASSRVPAVPVHSCSSLLQRLMKATADYCWRLFWVSLESLPLELVCSLWLAYIVASNISQDLQVSKTMLPQSLIRLHAEVFEDGLPCRHCLHGSCCSLLFCCDLRHLANFMAYSNRLLWLHPVKGHRLYCSGCSFPVSALHPAFCARLQASDDTQRLFCALQFYAQPLGGWQAKSQRVPLMSPSWRSSGLVSLSQHASFLSLTRRTHPVQGENTSFVVKKPANHGTSILCSSCCTEFAIFPSVPRGAETCRQFET